MAQNSKSKAIHAKMGGKKKAESGMMEKWEKYKKSSDYEKDKKSKY